MTYTIGSKQTIRNDLVVGGIYGNCQFAVEMCDFIGQKVTIESYDSEQMQYKIQDSGCKYFWHGSMFR